MIVAGVHGREHGGIRGAYRLAEFLDESPPARGTIEILPVINPASFAAETRENPTDGKNLGEYFAPGWPGGKEPGRSGQTEEIGRTILSRLEGCSHLLDLHSAGEARYLPHALFFREEDAPAAAACGLPFALLRRKTREGKESGMLCQAAVGMGVQALVLELGGGITTWPQDAEQGVQAILSLLAHWEYLPQSHTVKPTSPDRVHMRDARKFIRAWEEGAFYPSCSPGDSLAKGQRIGTWISLKDLEALPVAALESGLLIYLRTRCRSHGGDTLAMMLPEGSDQRMDKDQECNEWHR